MTFVLLAILFLVAVLLVPIPLAYILYSICTVIGLLAEDLRDCLKSYLERKGEK